jgi:hypothetical protein
MAVTKFQSAILRLLADRRKALGESYVAGGVALNQLIASGRLSRDIDLFHDTEAALASSWAGDRELLRSNDYDVQVLREAPSFVEARVVREGGHTLMQWARDSAYRFFPLMTDEILGLTLHPFDLATNKVLAMAGRLEPRDWIDVIHCDGQIQGLGYLVWAACGKDPGFNPDSLLADASRAHYSQAEIDTLDFNGPLPDARVLGKQWHEMLSLARQIVKCLPADEIGTCVVSLSGELFKGDADFLLKELKNQVVRFHAGRIGGSWPILGGL